MKEVVVEKKTTNLDKFMTEVINVWYFFNKYCDL